MKCKCWSCKSGQLSPTYTYTRCPRLHGHDVMLPPDCVISDYVNTWYCHQHNTGPLNTDHYLLTISMSTPNYCNTVMMAAAKVTVTVKKHINGHWQLSEATILIENKNLTIDVVFDTRSANIPGDAGGPLSRVRSGHSQRMWSHQHRTCHHLHRAITESRWFFEKYFC